MVKRVKKEERAVTHTKNVKELEREGKLYFLSWYDLFSQSLRREIARKPKEFLVIFVLTLFSTIASCTAILILLFNGVNVTFSPPVFSLPNFSGFGFSIEKSLDQKTDPVFVLTSLKKGKSEYVLVDIRSFDEFEKGHIKGAVNIPIYSTNLIKKDGTLDKGLIKKVFKDKLRNNKKRIIVYAHSQYSEYPTQVARIIGYNTQALAIGWNEWGHFKTLWVPESMWDYINMDEFVQTKE